MVLNGRGFNARFPDIAGQVNNDMVEPLIKVHRALLERRVMTLIFCFDADACVAKFDQFFTAIRDRFNFSAMSVDKKDVFGAERKFQIVG